MGGRAGHQEQEADRRDGAGARLVARDQPSRRHHEAEEAEGQPFLAGDNDRGWRMDLEFFASERDRERILDGKYRRAPKPGQAFDAASAIRIFHEHGYRHPNLTDEMLTAQGGQR